MIEPPAPLPSPDDQEPDSQTDNTFDDQLVILCEASLSLAKLKAIHSELSSFMLDATTHFCNILLFDGAFPTTSDTIIYALEAMRRAEIARRNFRVVDLAVQSKLCDMVCFIHYLCRSL